MNNAQPQAGEYRLFVTVPRGLAGVAAQEVEAIAASGGLPPPRISELSGGISFDAGLELAYRTLLWCRSGSRLLLQLASFPAPDSDTLYQEALTLPWERWISRESTLAIRVSQRSSRIDHTRFAMLRLKDAMVDHCRQSFGWRPAIDLETPALALQLHLDRDRALLHLDLGGALHQRGYRVASTPAPLRENLAAAMLLRAGWPEIAANGGALVDPMCGSGTLLIEGAWIAGDVAPALLRLERQPLIVAGGWPGHQPELFQRLLDEARERRDLAAGRLPPIVGSDHDPQAVEATLGNLAAAGLNGLVAVKQVAVSGAEPPATGRPGLLVINPPYGDRLGEEQDLTALYRAIGRRLSERFDGWEAALLTGNPALGLELGLKARRAHTLWNGPIECRLLRIAVNSSSQMIEPLNQLPVTLLRRVAEGSPLSPAAQAVANRLRKNLRQRGRQARRDGVGCYRIYDADIPEHAVAIDLYHDEKGGRWLVAQEYAPPPTIPAERARERLVDALHALLVECAIEPQQLFLKRRQRQRGSAQYRRIDNRGDYHVVIEGGARLWVNFTDHLDTGLFLDHRITRQRVARLASGRSFLNLFCYTGVATVLAALAGAATTTSVDLSANYLDWLGANLSLNGIDGPAHRSERADVLRWLEAQPAASYGVIFLDPPTFSTSSRMESTLDIQRDHLTLIDGAMRLLERDGVMLFSTNARRFRIDPQLATRYQLAEISDATIPFDFSRNQRIHRAWEVRWRNDSV